MSRTRSPFLKYHSPLNDFLFTMISHCSGQSKNNFEWQQVFKSLPIEFDLKFYDKRMQTTKNNYRALHELLTDNNVKLIAMQYPTLSIKVLRYYFQDHPDYRVVYPPYEDIEFISNEENFAQALKIKNIIKSLQTVLQANLVTRPQKEMLLSPRPHMIKLKK